MKIVPNNVLSILAIGFSSAVFAGNPPTPGIPPPLVPIDSGIVVLFAAAIILSAYKIYKFKNNKKASM